MPQLLQDDHFEVQANNRNGENAGKNGNAAIERRQGKAAVFEHFLNIADDDRRKNVIRCGKQHNEQHARKGLPMRFCIAQKATDDLAVAHVTFKAEPFFIVVNDHIRDDKNVDIVRGIKLVPNFPLLNQYRRFLS